ncbi:uncharacterized protein LOC123313369 [Coccinella septempunctata]|uniref:uncharacterized protein LOC123313369 n=1 Tax=Coccinella septempunctata TaxID=41139 RepID=UPI001D0854A8|nr:uncharacterized protein LOC123313369 [Coccinella septempunctata]
MPMSHIYGTSTDVDSDESLPHLDPSNSHYVDPWDLENYAYLKEHLDSDIPSDPTSLGDFVEAQSSFDYVPVLTSKAYPDTLTTMKYDSMLADQGTYACIDELIYERTRPQSETVYDAPSRRNFHHGRHSEIRVPAYNQVNSSINHRNRNKSKKNPPVTRYGSRDRSSSFAYGDGYDTYGYHKQGIYSKVEEKLQSEDIYYPIYDDPKSIRKPENFGLSKYGHLKIDYSYSWNNLNKYIVG